jgi:two-component system chemotaxis response regulator CheB
MPEKVIPASFSNLTINESRAMIIFCEECGKKHNLSFNGVKQDVRKILCQRCGDTITVLKPVNGVTNGAPQELAVNFRRLDKKKKRIKLLIVDDSKLIRRVIRGIFESYEHIEIVGEAENGVEALEMIPRLDPDVITLDVNMPVMSGLTTLKYIMIKYPKPTVMFSALTQEGASITFDALKFGAIDFIPKPSRALDITVEQQKADIVNKVTLAANVEIKSVRVVRSKKSVDKENGTQRKPCKSIYAIGAGEGGYGALLKMLPKLHADLPAAFLIVVYAPTEHVDAFTAYLKSASAISVHRARNNDALKAGVCYIICGTEYATVAIESGRALLKVHPSPFPSRKGAINMLMFSLAERFAKRTVGIILSGSGDDGVEGINEIIRQGGISIVQEPSTCLSKDMVQAAINRCKIDMIVADTQLATKVNELALKGR